MRVVLVLSALATVAMSTKMVGAPVDQPTDNAEAFDRVFTAINVKVNEGSNAEYYLVPVKLLKASSQVVAGVSYKYEVLVGESSCDKKLVKFAQINAANCGKIREGSNRFIYKVSVWEKPWENFVEYTVEKVREVAASEQF